MAGEPTQQDIQALTKSITDLTKSFSSTRTSTSASSRPGAATKLTSDSISSTDGGVRRLRRQLADAERGVKGLAKNSSLLAAATLKTSAKVLSAERQLVFFKDLLEKSNDLLKEDVNPNFIKIARKMNMLQDDADKFRDGLRDTDFVELSLAVANTSDTINKANAKAEELIKSIEAQVDDSGRAAIASIRAGGGSAMAQAAKIKASGVLGIDSDGNKLPGMVSGGLAGIMEELKEQLKDQGISAEALNVSSEKLIETFDSLNDETERVSKVFIQAAKDHTSALGALTHTTKTAKEHLHAFGNKVLQTAANLGTMANIQSKAMNAYQQMMGFNVAHIADSFMMLQARSVKFGMSFQDTMKLYQENARVLSVYGADNFSSLLGGLSNTFKKYGYTFEQGSRLIAPAIQNAVLSGVNVNNQAQMTAYMDQSLKNVQMMAAVSGKTPEAILALQQSALSSEAVFKNLAGMDKQRRSAYAKEITQTIDRLVLGGMEYEQAAEVVKLQTQAARAPIREKMEKAAFGQIGSSLAGMSGAEGARLARLERKTRRTSAEEVEMLALQERRATGIQRRRQAEEDRTGGEAWSFAVMEEAITGKMFGGPAVDAAQRAALRREAGLGVSDAAAAAAGRAGAGSPAVAGLGQTINQISSLMTNALGGAIIGVIAGLGATARTAMTAAWALRQLGLVGGAGGALPGGGPGGAASKGGWVGSLVKGAARAGLGMGVGMAGDWLGEKIGGRTGAAISGAATGLGLGLMSKNPYVMLGATLGGAALGAYNYEGGSTGEAAGVNTDTLAAESMQSLSNQTVTVTDKEAVMNLQAISASMNEAVILLRAMAPGGTVATRGSTFQVPSAAEFVTGNG